MNDVIIIGAGPAGISAAISCAEHGLDVLILDEFMKPGGRLLGQLHEEPDGSWWNGIKEAEKLVEKALNIGVKMEFGQSVYDIEQTEHGWNIFTTNKVLFTPALLIATGASETPIPLPGWTLPGVMSIGAAQVMTNVHRVKPGCRGVVIGINILSMAITRELRLADIDIQGVLLPARNSATHGHSDPKNIMESMLQVSHLAPSPLIRLGSKLMRNDTIKKLGLMFYPKNGIKVWDAPIQLKKAVIEIGGEYEVEYVRVADIDSTGKIIKGTEQKVDVDFVCIAGGLSPLVELIAVAGCPLHYMPELGGHIPLHSNKMETALPGLFVAGNITGIESSKVAMAQGTVAGLSIARYLLSEKNQLEELLYKAIDDVAKIRKNSSIQFHPNIIEAREQLEQLWSKQYVDKAFQKKELV